MNGAELIAAERTRQINDEGWTPGHDAQWKGQELGFAARCYLDRGLNLIPHLHDPSPFWPWDAAWWKPSEEPIRNLIKAGALIAAEIDRQLQEFLKTQTCPQCGVPTVQANLGGGKTDVYCEECGWPDENLPEHAPCDCICFACLTASHNGGDDDCACDDMPWFDAPRCGSCKHQQVCDVAKNPNNYPAPGATTELSPSGQ
jgi:hypothetical protein